MQPFESNPCWLKSSLDLNIERHLPNSTCLWMLLIRLNAKCPFVCTCNQLRNPDYKRFSNHDDAIKWKHFPRYWPFMRGIHPSAVNSPHKGQWHEALMFSLICAWINGWVNRGWWFETLSRPLWRHSNGLTDIAFDHVFYRTGDLVQTPWDLAGNLAELSASRITCLLDAKPRISDINKYDRWRTINVLWNLV